MSAQNQVTDLLKITSRLVDVLEREIEMLRAMRPSDIETLQQDKIALTAAYESQVKSLASQPEFADAVQPALRAELETAIGKFQSTLAANERALGAAKHTTQRVLQAIADEVDRKRNENAGYSASGTVAAPPRGSSGQPVSVAIDECF